MAINKFVPQYTSRNEQKRTRDVITATDWNELWNLNSQQGDHSEKYLLDFTAFLVGSNGFDTAVANKIGIMDSGKEDKSTADLLCASIEYNSTTGVFVFKNRAGNVMTTVDLNIEKIPVSVEIVKKPNNEYWLVIHNTDLSTTECPVSSFFKPISFNSSDSNYAISFTTTDVSGTTDVKATIKLGGIIWDHLSADVKSRVSGSSYYAEVSEAYAKGTKGGSPVAPGSMGHNDNSYYYKGLAETAKTGAEAAEAQALTYKGQAQDSATAAANSATNAADSATAAATSASSAASSESTIQGYATTASAAATAAAASESNAYSSAYSANISKNNAATSETNAATSESNAATSESNALTSETNAATSATNAANSAISAASSETNAATSESNASTSKLASEGWAVGKQNGVDVGTTSPYYHNNAKYYSEHASPASIMNVLDYDASNTVKTAGGIPAYVATQIANNKPVFWATYNETSLITIKQKILDGYDVRIKYDDEVYTFAGLDYNYAEYFKIWFRVPIYDKSLECKEIYAIYNGESDSWYTNTIAPVYIKPDPDFPVTTANTGKILIVSGNSDNATRPSNTDILELMALLNGHLPYSSTVPTSDNTDGLILVHLASAPATRYNGYIYMIDE